MSENIVHGRYLITRASGHETSVLEQGAIYQNNGVIKEVGAFQELSQKHPDVPVLGGDDFLVMPGLINAHHHGKGVSPLMKGSLDDHLEYWMADSWGRKSVDMYLDTLYACMKMLRSGVTTVMFNLSPGAAADTPEDCEKALTAFADAGMRVNFSVYVESQYRIIAEDESVFLGRLPTDLAARAKEVLDNEHISDDDYIALSESLHARHHDGEFVRVMLSPANAHWCSDALLERMRATATGLGTGLHIHLVESVYEKLIGLKIYGKTALAHLDDLGFLGPDVSLAHAVWLTGGDLDLVKERGVHVCTNPSSNLRLRTGIAPVAEMAARGLNLALGTDSTSLNEDEDFLQEMRLAHRLHRNPGVNSPTLTADKIVSMATLGGARATMFDDIGALEPGKKADLITIRLDNITEPYLDPESPIVDALVYKAKGSDVDTVMIDGRVMVEGGRVISVNEQRMMESLKGELSRPLSEEARSRRRTAEELKPYIKRFYEAWEPGQDKPFYVYNNAE